MKSPNKQVTDRCDYNKVLDLFIRMVKAPSHPGIKRQEEQTVKELSQFLTTHHIEHEIIEVEEGRPNLLATIEGPQAGNHLLFCGHTDTVPPNSQGSTNPFSAVEKDGRLYGRGTADMKGAVAAMAGALANLKVSGQLKSGRVTLAAVVDEEMKSLGTESLIKSGFKADAVIVGEPTQNLISIGNRGLEWLRIDFKGRAAHGSTPQAGINAISAAARFVHFIENELVPDFQRRIDPALGSPAINMGTIEGGESPSTVAAHCSITLDRRWVTTESIEDVFEDLEKILDKIRREKPGLKTKITRVPDNMATMIHGPVAINVSHPIVVTAQKVLTAFGQPSEPLTVFPGWTDASLLSREGKIPAIIWGPGEIDCAHSPDESIRLNDVFLAADMYTEAAIQFCGTTKVNG
ncbi:M20 family metallopeptidase [bacterium]|nr:M20 family metallopeptidase [bacterium]